MTSITSLVDLFETNRIHIWAIVNTFEISKGKNKLGKDQLILRLTLIDPSQTEDPVSCTIFGESLCELPPVEKKGDLIRITSLVAKSKAHSITGAQEIFLFGKASSLTIGVWDLDGDSNDTRQATANTSVLSLQDLKYLSELRSWYREQTKDTSVEKLETRGHQSPPGHSASPITLEEWSQRNRHFFDICFQLIGRLRYKSDHKFYNCCRVLIVWDATKFQDDIELAPIEDSHIDWDRSEVDEFLYKAAGNMAIFLFAFDEWVEVADKIRIGQLMLCRNVRTSVLKEAPFRRFFKLQGGTASRGNTYGRFLRELPLSSPHASNLMKRISEHLKQITNTRHPSDPNLEASLQTEEVIANNLKPEPLPECSQSPPFQSPLLRSVRKSPLFMGYSLSVKNRGASYENMESGDHYDATSIPTKAPSPTSEAKVLERRKNSRFEPSISIRSGFPTKDYLISEPWRYFYFQCPKCQKRIGMERESETPDQPSSSCKTCHISMDLRLDFVLWEDLGDENQPWGFDENSKIPRIFRLGSRMLTNKILNNLEESDLWALLRRDSLSVTEKNILDSFGNFSLKTLKNVKYHDVKFSDDDPDCKIFEIDDFQEIQ